MTEEQKAVELLEQRGYRFFKNGSVRRHKKPYVCSIDGRGYPRVLITLDGRTKSFSTHRIIAEKFIPNPENKPEVNHKDGNKRNFKRSNLEWATRAENQQHSFRNKLNRGPYGTKCANAKLTDKIIVEIRSAKGVSQSKLARRYGVDQSNISNILKRKTWKHV